MEKIKIEIKEQENIIAKYGKQKIEIKPYISSIDSVIINEIVVNNYNKYKLIENDNEIQLSNEQLYIPYIRAFYLSGVLHQCSNLDIEGVDFNILSTSGLEKIVKENIYNYEEMFNLILEGIKQDNLRKYFFSLEENIPDVLDAKNGLESVIETLEKTSKDTKLQEIVETSIGENCKEAGFFVKSDKTKESKPKSKIKSKKE